MKMSNCIHNVIIGVCLSAGVTSASFAASHCRYCGSETYGSCQDSPSGRHEHIPGEPNGGSLRAHVGHQTEPTPVSLQFSGRQISNPVESNVERPMTVKASVAFDSFFGVTFGESIHSGRFESFIDAAKKEGKDFSNIRDAEMKKNIWLHRLESKFRSYDNVIVQPNPKTGKVYWIGILSETKCDDAEDRAEFQAIRRWVLSRYGHLNFTEVTEKTNATVWNNLVNAGCPGGVVRDCCSFFLVPNSSGEWSHVITLCLWTDRNEGKTYIRFSAEDIALEQDTGEGSTNVSQDTKQSKQGGDALARAKAALARKKLADEKTNQCRQKGPDSFCGIPFGSTVNGEMQRIGEGKYLTCLIGLKTPFRGIKTATVYASVSTKRIFCIQLRSDVIDDVFGVEGAVEKRYGFEGVGGFHPLGGYQKSWEFFNGDVIKFEWEFVDNGPRQRMLLQCTNRRFLKLADQEFQEESGGDGSSVL